jgi:hypothetical protein
MNLTMFLILAILAFVLSPGILIRLPPGGNSRVVAATHALVIALVWFSASKTLWHLTK